MPLRWSIPHPAAAKLEPPLVMGILNVTPDSFSDGGLHLATNAAIDHAWQLAREGAHILDVGGESTRPGAKPVEAAAELDRVLPVVRALAAGGYPLPISIDTSKAAVARACLAEGACIVNDVTALRGDPEMAAVARESGAAVCLMHMLGEPRTMQNNPAYKEVVAEVTEFLRERMKFAVEQGIGRERILLDPGIGFGKRLEHNLALLRACGAMSRALDAPFLIAPSRKRFIGELLDSAPPTERLEGTLAAVASAAIEGAEVVRVHDVLSTVKFLRVFQAIRSARFGLPNSGGGGSSA